jgi:hypothetical protein
MSEPNWGGAAWEIREGKESGFFMAPSFSVARSRTSRTSFLDRGDSGMLAIFWLKNSALEVMIHWKL